MGIDGQVLARIGIQLDLLICTSLVNLTPPANEAKRSSIRGMGCLSNFASRLIHGDFIVSADADIPVVGLHHRHDGRSPIRKMDGFNNPLLLKTLKLFLHFFA